MQEILPNVKNTAISTGELPKEENETIYESDTGAMMCEKMFKRFSVGDFYIIYGTEAHEFDRKHQIPSFPDWMELRIRCNAAKMLVVFFPKGLVAFEFLKLSCMGTKKQFKCEILHREQLGFKIWRSK